MLAAIIVAGGSSRRMGIDKTFASLGGKPVLAHTVRAFESADCIEEIILVGHPKRIEQLHELIAHEGFHKIHAVVPGGKHRQDSVVAGLRELTPAHHYVAVHDAARPLVRPKQIAQVYEMARTHGAAALAAPVIDTLKRATADGVVCGSLDREGVFAMQTPQIFARDLLEKAFASVAAHHLAITDEVSAVQHLGRQVWLVTNDDFNFKITHPADLALAEFVLRQRLA